MTTNPKRKRWRDAPHWLLLYSLLWYLLSGGQGWELGLASAFLATAAALKLQLQPSRIHYLRLPGFLLFFSQKVIAGAWDVARRTVHPGCPLNPAWVVYELNASTSVAAGSLCSAMVGLLPGTLASKLDKRQMHLHILDDRQPWQPTVAKLEQQLDQLLISRESN